MAQANRASKMAPPARQRQNREQGLALVEQWHRSGLRPSEFCRERGVAEHRLHYWKRRLRERQVQTREAGREFFAVVAGGEEAPAPVEVGSQLSVEIRMAPAICVRVPLAAGAGAFVQTLRGVLELAAR